MTNSTKPLALAYSLDEARHLLRRPPISRTGIYQLIREGILEISGYYGDRPFFDDATLLRCNERLKTKQPAQKKQQQRKRPGPANAE